MKKLISLILAIIICMSAGVLSSCNIRYTDPTEGIEVQTSQDKYRNYYEIFVGSFCDSNGDNIGDLQGIISKLDYLNDGNPQTDTDLGVDGIWLTPIMPSHSYHKYDVIDYYNIDESFGTLQDFDTLVEECHKRGINIVIDMVINHCSKFMPLFQKACHEVMQGITDDSAEYFDINYFDSNPGSSYTEIGNGYYYTSNFSPYMPEWNLDADCTREYLIDVADFWLNDHNVDGFRLDAVKYFDDIDTNGQEFLTWYYDAVKDIKPDVYMVGELWTGNAEIHQMYNSKIDSLFAFGFAGATGDFIKSVRLENASTLVSNLQKYYENSKQSNQDAINCFFLSNHDQVRAANSLKGDGTADTKMAAATYMLVPGNPFIYYGEEIGLVQDSQADGDEFKREPMVWDTSNPPQIRVNDITGYDESQAPHGGVEQQLSDEYSILNYYKRIIKIKNQNPEIARGKITQEIDFDDNNVSAYIIESDGTKLVVIHNFNSLDSKVITLGADIENPVIRGDLVASNNGKKDQHITLKGKMLTMPPQSTVILKTAD